MFFEKRCPNIVISRHEVFWFYPIVITKPNALLRLVELLAVAGETMGGPVTNAQ